jgi:hypothetical protein
MRQGLISCLALLLVLPIFSQTSSPALLVTLAVGSTHYLVGEPITLRARIANAGENTLYLAYGEHGVTSNPLVENLSGSTVPFCPPQDVKTPDWAEGHELKPLAAGTALERTEVLCDFTRAFAPPGHYRFSWQFQSTGPYEKRIKGQLAATYPQAWTGTAKSPPVEIEIVMPTGVDREALEKIIRPAVQNPATIPSQALWAEKVLITYPTSTYAGYALGLGQGFDIKLDAKPEYIIKTLWKENYIQNNPLATIHRSVPKDGKACIVLDSMPMRELLHTQRGKIEAFLALHPDFARREILELSKAYQSLALGDKNTAVGSLEWVVKSAPTKQWRTQAQAILELLSAKPGKPK